MSGSTLLLLLAPGGSGSTPTPTADGTQFVGPFGWSFLFPGATAGPAPDLPGSLLGALRAIYLASPVPGLTGGLKSVAASAGARMPFATVEERAGHAELRTSASDRQRVPLVVRVYAPTGKEAGALLDALDAVLAGENPDFAGATASPIRRDGEPRRSRDPSRARAGADCWYAERRYYTRVRRARA